MVKKIFSGYKYLNQIKFGRSTTMNSKTKLQSLQANPVSGNQRLSDKVSITQSSVVHHHHNQIGFHITKILQNIWLTKVLLIY